MAYIKPDFTLDYRPNPKISSPSYKDNTDVIDGFLQFDVIKEKAGGIPRLEKFKLKDDIMVLATYEKAKVPHIIYIDTNGDIKVGKPELPTKQKQP